MTEGPASLIGMKKSPIFNAKVAIFVTIYSFNCQNCFCSKLNSSEINNKKFESHQG